MTLRELFEVILRRWWLVAIVPVIVLPLLVVCASREPYQTTVRAVVLLPGDKEIPGNSERPELMVLDDLPSLLSSTVFAEAVSSDLAQKGTTVSADTVKGALAGSRYSRILTITVTSDDSAQAKVIADSAAAVLPGAVNQYLVADGAQAATVDILDPPGDPTRSRPNQKAIMGALTVLAAGVGVGLALLAHAWSIGGDEQVEKCGIS